MTTFPPTTAPSNRLLRVRDAEIGRLKSEIADLHEQVVRLTAKADYEHGIAEALRVALTPFAELTKHLTPSGRVLGFLVQISDIERAVRALALVTEQK